MAYCDTSDFSDELKRHFTDSGAKLVFTSPQSLAKVQNAAQGSSVEVSAYHLRETLKREALRC